MSIVAPPVRCHSAGRCEVLSISSDSVSSRRLGRSVSLDQAADLLKVSRRTVYNRIRNGRLHTIRTPGGSQRVLVESIFPFGFRRQPFSSARSAVLFDVRIVRS